MKTKLVLWGIDANDSKVLIALQLRPEENKVDLWTFPDKDLTDAFVDDMLNKWRNGQEVAFPESKTHIIRELSVSESLLPEDLKVKDGHLIQRAQTEWHFVVLSMKLNELYENELGDIKTKVDSLTAFSSDVFNELKEFWNKVQGQIREKNLIRDHSDKLRNNTNDAFARLKELRASLDEEFRTASKEYAASFHSTLDEIDKKMEGGRLSAVFEELKGIQNKFRDTKFTKEHRSELWDRIDKAFKKVKDLRFGPNANNGNSAMDRLKRRYDGLINAIEKMDRSISRDKKDLEFQDRKINTTDGQLEAQIRQAKVSMIKERINSKLAKHTEMLATKKELEARMETQKQKDAKRAEKVKLEEAKQEAKKKIANNIKQAEEQRSNKDGALAAAASAIIAGKAATSQTAKNVVEKVKEAAGDIAEMVEEVVDDIKESVAEVIEEAGGVNEDNGTDLIKDATSTAEGIASINLENDGISPISSEEE